ncbi:MAG: DUF2383 domain-containing protein [Gemmatirosa sp.]|nr:DUF2383 domain-containing protein [Gemmatirosa sp.]
MTGPTAAPAALPAAALAALNDLLEVDHDAVAATTRAIGALTNIGRRETLVRFRADHERHVAELTRLVRRHGGTPAVAPRTPGGPFARAMQRLGTLGGDREVIVAFRTASKDVRDRYAKAVAGSEALPSDLQATLRAAADDHERHHDWADDQLDTLGAGAEPPAGLVAGAVERVQARFAEGLGRAESSGRRGLEVARRRVADARQRLPEPSGRALAVGVAAAVVGFAVTTAIETARRRR